jgi:hypothetical protein
VPWRHHFAGELGTRRAARSGSEHGSENGVFHGKPAIEMANRQIQFHGCVFRGHPFEEYFWEMNSWKKTIIVLTGNCRNNIDKIASAIMSQALKRSMNSLK